MNGGLRDGIFDEVLLGGHVVGQCECISKQCQGGRSISTIKDTGQKDCGCCTIVVQSRVSAMPMPKKRIMKRASGQF